MILVNLLSAVSGGSVTYLNNIVPRLIKLDTENCFLFLITQSKFDKLVTEYNSIGLYIENRFKPIQISRLLYFHLSLVPLLGLRGDGLYYYFGS